MSDVLVMLTAVGLLVLVIQNVILILCVWRLQRIVACIVGIEVEVGGMRWPPSIVQ